MQHGDFILSADSVFCCSVLFLFSMVVTVAAVVATDSDIGDKTFDCALVSVLDNYSGQLENGNS